jgi:hypothetical protein
MNLVYPPIGSGKILMFRSGFLCLVNGRDRCVDSSADIEITDHLHKSRLNRANQVVENSIRHSLMEGSFISERPKIQFEGFEFDAKFIRDISDLNGRKIRLSGFGAKTSKLRAVKTYLIVAIRLGIRECVKLFGRLACQG